MSPASHKIFIGHGGAPVWRELKDFIQERLHLPWEEFNRIPQAGITTLDRLKEMLASASFAFLIMTREDELADGTLRARENVIHEAGLFQGYRLSSRKSGVHWYARI
jgi:predicted nucleotide-binding protein